MGVRDLKMLRQERGWTQSEAAERLGVTQAYLSMLESQRRALSTALSLRVRRIFDLPPTELPLPPATQELQPVRDERLKAALGALGYPGFAHLSKGKPRNPAELLIDAIGQDDLDSRIAEGLPWLVLHFADWLNWDWLLDSAKLNDLQNRLGFIVTMAKTLATAVRDRNRAEILSEMEAILDQSRLVREDTLARSSLTEAERKWLRRHRPAEAAHWNLLTDMKVENLTHAADR